jgi:hypothetical protein
LSQFFSFFFVWASRKKLKFFSGKVFSGKLKKAFLGNILLAIFYSLLKKFIKDLSVLKRNNRREENIANKLEN